MNFYSKSEKHSNGRNENPFRFFIPHPFREGRWGLFFFVPGLKFGGNGVFLEHGDHAFTSRWRTSVDLETLSWVGASIVVVATPALLAALGELVVEKSGVLNLGLEGMMLVGAVCGFATAHSTGNNLAGVAGGALGAIAVSLVFALLTQVLLTNQVATGLALTIFGTSLSALIGQDYVGVRIDKIRPFEIPLLADIPFLGVFLFRHDPVVYLSVLLVFLTFFFIYRSKPGLILRSVGENHDAAFALGYPVTLIRTGAIVFGAALAGIAGSYLSLSYTPHWAEGMTAGKGWIALALVVFSAWKPFRLMLGAYLFGAILMLQLYLQGLGVPVSPQLLSMTPYAATIVVLVLISRDEAKMRLNVPGSLGKTFFRD